MDEFLQLSIIAIIVIVLLLWYLNKDRNNSEGYGLDSSFINSAGSVAGPTSNITQYIDENNAFMEREKRERQEQY